MGAIAQVLRQLPRPSDPNLLVGTDLLDDGGVYQLDASTALVMTLDFFPPLVDDAYAFGRIAAANALSDIYAMGGRPVCALNIVGFPDKELPAELLGEILRGGAERVSAAGAVVAGGHSVRDSEIKYGLAVTGTVHPKRILTNAAARAGDVLVLTKPLGSGILTSAAKAGRISEGELAEAIDVMTDLNDGACEAIREVGPETGGDQNAAPVHAVTDVTGFGLIGHADEMAKASGVTIRLSAGHVPLMERALELARVGVVTRAHASNLECVGERFKADGVDDVLIKVLADAQTSGGLLIAVDEQRAGRLIEHLRARRTRSAAIVGRVAARSAHTVVISA